MKKRVLTLLMSLCFVIGLLPCVALAAETSSVTTEANLKAAIAQGGTVTLGGDINLTEVLTVSNNVTVVLDLNGHTLTQTGTKARYDDDGSEYQGPINGINNEGTLTINDTSEGKGGKITGTWNCIYNAGTLTINGGTYQAKNNAVWNGDYYENDDGESITASGTLTINGGTFTAEDWEGVYNAWGNVTISGCTFGECGDYVVCNESGTTSNVTITGGSYTSGYFYDCEITGGTFGTGCRISGEITDGSFSNCQIGANTNISGGTFTDLTSFGGSVAGDASVTIDLENATLCGTITGGTFTGTVGNVSTSLQLRGGTFTEAQKQVIEAHANYKPQTGYGFVENTDDTYTVTNVGTVKISIKSNNKEYGQAGVSKYAAGSGYGTGGLDELTNITVTKGGTITFSAAAKPTGDTYVFAGWFTNADGTGTPVSSVATLTDFKYTVNADTTLYAVFQESTAYQAKVAAVQAWVEAGSYTISSTEDMYTFAFAVNNLGETFAGKTVTLAADLNYTAEGAAEFVPVGGTVKFAGTFDGGNHTISGITQSGGYDKLGIFGYNVGTIKNLNVKNCEFTGNDIGGIAAWSEGTIENCSVTDCTLKGGYWYCGGIVGHSFGMTMTNVVSAGNDISGWKYGAIIGYADNLTLTGAEVSGITDSGSDTGMGGLVGGHINAGTTTLENIQVTEPATGMALIGSTYSGSATTIVIKGDDTDIDVTTIVPDTSGMTSLEIAAGSCTVSEPMTVTSGTTLKLTSGTIETTDKEAIAVLAPGSVVEKSDGTVATVADGETSGAIDEFGNLILPAGSTVAKSGGETETQKLTNDAVILPDGTIIEGTADEAPTVATGEDGAITVTVPVGGSVTMPDGTIIEGSEDTAPEVTYSTDNNGDTTTNVTIPAGGGVTKPNEEKETMPTGGSATSSGENTTVSANSSGSNNSSGGSSSGSSIHTVSLDSVENGSISVSPKSASKGTTVTLMVSPDDGYELSSLTVTDASGNVLALTDKGNGKYTFTMPASKVTVSATFKATVHDCPSAKFTDVDISQYYHEAIDWAVTNGITYGTSATTFEPNASCTRAQMVTFLWRAAGSPAPASTVNPFEDVKSGEYYYNAVLWAVKNGITLGTSDTTFSPDETVTRGQTVTFLYRYAGSPAASGGSFADVAADAYYAPAVQWAVANGITNGTSSTTFSPEDDCTRGQIVTFLWRDMA